MDAAARAAQFPRRVVRIRPLHVLHDLQPLVDRVGGDIGRDLVGQPGGERGVRPVHGDLVRHPAGPEPGAEDPRPAPHLRVRPGLPQRGDDLLARLGQPRVQRGGVTPGLGPFDTRHLLLGHLLLGPGPHHELHPAQGAARVPDQFLQRPVRAGRHGGGQVGPGGHQRPQQADLVGDFVAVAVVREECHASHPRRSTINRAPRFPPRRTPLRPRPRPPAPPAARTPPPGAGLPPAGGGPRHGCP